MPVRSADERGDTMFVEFKIIDTPEGTPKRWRVVPLGEPKKVVGWVRWNPRAKKFEFQQAAGAKINEATRRVIEIFATERTVENEA